MIQLTPDESRVLGVLVEKEKTTPDGYPLTLNAAANGAAQKSNRFPVLEFDEDRAREAMTGLREKGLVVRIDTPGSRAPKFRHNAYEKLGVNAREMALLAELLLRGPQTLGELRGRASRMHPLDSLDMVRSTLEQMMARPEPMVRAVPPAPGSRAGRYAQLLCPALHPLDGPAGEGDDAGGDETESAAGALPPAAEAAPAGAGPAPAALASRVERLEGQVAVLRDALRKLAAALGEPDPTGGESNEE